MFNASLAGDLDAVDRWNDLYGVTLSDEPRSLFQRYLDTGDYVIFQSLVDHPRVPDIELYRACSVVFQRGDIYFARGRQDLFLRSYFHSVKSADEFVNFAPAGGLRISFESDRIWYPLEVTQLNTEPTSVVLNVMTEDPLPQDQVPEGFKVQKRGRVVHGISSYSATRLTATFPGGKTVSDVNISM